MTALPQLELREVAGENETYEVYAAGECVGFMFLISPERGWLAQLQERDEPAQITPRRAEAERWLQCQVTLRELLLST